MNLRKLIKETLLLERKIAQISDTFQITFGFDISTSKHTRDRSNLGREGLSDRVISNQEIIDVIEKYKRDIAEAIINGYIIDGDKFVIKDKDSKIDCAILATILDDNYWSLLILTIFPASDSFGLLVAQDQFVLSK